MKKVYIGLGNPGQKYENNRHNAGFMFIQYLLKSPQAQLKSTDENSRLESMLYNTTFRSRNCTFVEPQTYMNKSGEAVRKVLDFYKYSVEDIVVIYDDLDIRLGEYKIHEGAGPRTHNGILSLEENLKTQSFTQVRIGVDNRSGENRIKGETYVLQDFTPEEMAVLINEVFPQILRKIP